MLLGDVCTRSCRFCGVATGDPQGAIDRDEPDRLAAAVAELGLRYAVLTSVDRDDLADGGAGLFATAVDRLKGVTDEPRVEVLIPDFAGDEDALDRLAATGADVFGHNLETVRRLSPRLRDRRAGYDQSLAVLRHLTERADGRPVKSGLMVGLGESRSEIVETFGDLRRAGVGIVTVGQYLRPSVQAVPVERYVEPAEFEEIAADARKMGFGAAVAGPLVRSSYHAAEAYARSCVS